MRPRPDALAASRRTWRLARRQATRWRLAYLGLVAICADLARTDPGLLPVLCAWLVAGAVASLVDSVYLLDDRERRRRHATSAGALLVAGYRARPDAAPLDAYELDELALLGYLHAHVEVHSQPVRGHHPGATRLTYRHGVRELARAWCRASGRPLRHADAVLAQLEARGLVRRVRISQVQAYRLLHPTLGDALRAWEQQSGRPIVDWALGPAADPAPAPLPARGDSPADEAARA